MDVTSGNRVESVSDHGKHLNHGYPCSALREEFHDIQADCPASDDHNLPAFHMLRIFRNPLDHF